jgi:hypothetical protein
MKFRSYIGKRVHVSPGKEVVFGAEEYETENEAEIEALKYAVEVLIVGGDGTDGTGRKIKLSKNHTLEPETSPEADSLAVSENTSDAELLLEAVKEKDGERQVFKSDSTQAVNEAKQAAKDANNGKLTTEQSNAIEENSKNPKK